MDQFPSKDGSHSQSVDFQGIQISHEQIFSVVSDFYQSVAKDELLEKAFSDVSDWPHHIQLMTHFWWIRLGGGRYLSYSYNPIPKHFAKGFNDILLKRWLSLFKTTLEKHLASSQVNAWYPLAASIGDFLLSRNESLRSEKLNLR